MTTTKLVIGASGFLGSHVAKQLVARGDDVRVLLRSTSSTRGIEGLAVDVWRGDLVDPDTVRSDHSKAVRELGWEPSPTCEAIIAAAHFFRTSHPTRTEYR
ncbi:NAD dependent epimerase/dehydratase family protein [Mycolicibacterium rutilum]|uniref:NAD dependent epimerase/dehydratase family protein n=1 Tax=Mycolicibacterium rutilum TaxID=370526 RepID=A0A1H6LWH0_MYCRU|nr:NAD dependent epimerase/dehydratase family protein [Mycolicibacterium rutilum]